MAFKLVISDGKSGLSVQKELNDEATKGLIGLKIGDSVKGETVDLQGFEFQLTGGSDYCGFPMRRDVQGTGRRKILAYQGVGFRKDRKGILQRKTVCGNTIHAKTAQINLKITKPGTSDIFEEVKKKLGEKNKDKKVEKSEAKETEKKKDAPTESTGKDKKESKHTEPAAEKAPKEKTEPKK